MDHPTVIETLAVERYLLGELSPGERDEFEEHFFTCSDCARAVRTGAILAANGRSLALDGRSGSSARSRTQKEDPSEPRGRPFRPGPVAEMKTRPGAFPRWIPAIAAGLFFCLAGYQQVRILRMERGAETPLQARAVTRTVLHSQSRGAVPVIRVPGSEDPILTLELSADRPLPAYSVDILRNGKTVGTIPNATVKDGGIDIEIPSADAPGRYEILVREPAGKSEAGRFPFQLDK